VFVDTEDPDMAKTIRVTAGEMPAR